MSAILVGLVGAGVGVAFGALGAGGSALATPALALLGVPAVVAVASPLPAMVPAALAGARQYARSGLLDRSAALLAVVVGVPAVVSGAIVSRFVGGAALVGASAVLLFVAGVRMLLPVRGAPSGPAGPNAGAERALAPGAGAPPISSGRRTSVVLLMAGAAFLSGLLANGGGFLFVPIFVFGLGLGASRAAGTSMLAVAALVVPTLLVHWSLGHVDWTVAAAFAVGVIPATSVGARLGRRLPDATARRVFGVVLVAFATCFVAARML
ncbi:MAG: sulfite exporter TauE/SafE family protein [Acidimicrobiia bacterium]